MASYEPEDDCGRIRRLRKRAGFTQVEFGQLMGRSQGWGSGIENGDLELDSVTLIVRAASVLKVYPNEITGRPYDPGTRAEDRGHRAIPAIRRVVSRHDLPPDWPVEPRSRRELEAAVEHLETLRMAARYADLGEAAPNLIREIHAAAYLARPGQEESERLHGLLARAYREADTVAHELGYDDLSTLTTERFRSAADRSGDPWLPAVFDYLRVRDLWAADLGRPPEGAGQVWKVGGRVRKGAGFVGKVRVALAHTRHVFQPSPRRWRPNAPVAV